MIQSCCPFPCTLSMGNAPVYCSYICVDSCTLLAVSLLRTHQIPTVSCVHPMRTQVVLNYAISSTINLLSPCVCSCLPNHPVVLPGIATDVDVNVCVNTKSTRFRVYQTWQSGIFPIQSPTQDTPVQVVKETLSISYTMRSGKCRNIHIRAGTK